MSAFMQFEVFGVAQPQGSSRAFMHGGRPVITSTNPKLKDWREQVSRAAREFMNGLPPLDSPVEVEVAFYLPRPKSVKREAPTVKPDLDKLVRAVLDGLTNIIYRDDAQVTSVRASKHYVTDAIPNPVAAITVK